MFSHSNKTSYRGKNGQVLTEKGFKGLTLKFMTSLRGQIAFALLLGPKIWPFPFFPDLAEVWHEGNF